MIALLDILLVGGTFGIAVLGAIACLRGGKATRSWAVTFAAIGVVVAWAWATGVAYAGFVGLGLWLLFVGAPLAALRRSVRAIVVEDHDDAERWSRLAGLLHPSAALRIQREVVGLMRRLDDGDLDGALPRLREIAADHPELDAWSPADELRFTGDWDGVRAWMERELTAEQRRTEVRHVVPYLMSLAETGDARALVDEYEAARPALARLRGWGLHEMAQLVVATTCGLRERVESLLAGPLARLPSPVQSLVRASLRMAEGDVEAGRAEIARLRDRLSFANRLVADRRLQDDPPDVSDELRERARSLLAAPPSRSGRSVGRRLVQLVAAGFVVLLAVKVWAPWRDVGPSDGDGEPLRYIERVVGTDDFDAWLPLLVLLHGYGSGPENLQPLCAELSTPARVVLPAGPHTAGLGRAWFDLEATDAAAAQRDEAVRRVVAFARGIASDRPTRGVPVVAGFSQGGMVSFVIAARFPDAAAAVFPIAGALGDDVAIATDAASRPPVHVFHGEVDELVSIAEARDAVRRLRAAGHEVEFSSYPGLGHTIDARLLDDFTAAVDAALATQARR